MFQSHWGLRELPFSGSLDPKDFHNSPAHEEALARLHFLVENRRRLGILLGQRGSGKSLLLKVFASELARQGHVAAHVSLLGMGVDEFVWTLATRLGINPPLDAPLFHSWRAITDRLAEHRYQQLVTAILLDDADEAQVDVLTQVVRLLNLDSSPNARVTTVLAADPNRVINLGHRLLDLSELRIELELWQQDETADFLRQSVADAGGEEPIFDEAAQTRLHELGQGTPRQVNQLAQLAMLAGAGQELDRVDAETVESVYEELSVAVD